MSTRSLPPTVHYTLEFEKYEQILGVHIENEEPHFHYMQTGSGGQIIDPKTHKLIPAPEPKRPQIGQLYLALLNEPQQIKQLVEITIDDIDALKQAALQKYLKILIIFISFPFSPLSGMYISIYIYI